MSPIFQEVTGSNEPHGVAGSRKLGVPLPFSQAALRIDVVEKERGSLDIHTS